MKITGTQCLLAILVFSSAVTGCSKSPPSIDYQALESATQQSRQNNDLKRSLLALETSIRYASISKAKMPDLIQEISVNYQICGHTNLASAFEELLAACKFAGSLWEVQDTVTAMMHATARRQTQELLALTDTLRAPPSDAALRQISETQDRELMRQILSYEAPYLRMGAEMGYPIDAGEPPRAWQGKMFTLITNKISAILVALDNAGSGHSGTR